MNHHQLLPFLSISLWWELAFWVACCAWLGGETWLLIRDGRRVRGMAADQGSLQLISIVVVLCVFGARPTHCVALSDATGPHIAEGMIPLGRLKWRSTSQGGDLLPPLAARRSPGRSQRAHSNRSRRGDRGAHESGHGPYVAFQTAEVAMPRQMFQEILRLIPELRPQPPPEHFRCRPTVRPVTDLTIAA